MSQKSKIENQKLELKTLLFTTSSSERESALYLYGFALLPSIALSILLKQRDAIAYCFYSVNSDQLSVTSDF